MSAKGNTRKQGPQGEFTDDGLDQAARAFDSLLLDRLSW